VTAVFFFEVLGMIFSALSFFNSPASPTPEHTSAAAAAIGSWHSVRQPPWIVQIEVVERPWLATIRTAGYLSSALMSAAT
jgi:hypothetical protein